MGKLSYKRLGDYISPVDVRNKDMQCDNLLGLSIAKTFIPSIANMVGADLRSYKLVHNNQFAYVPVTSRNGDKITIALYRGEKDCVVSQAYTVFEVTDTSRLLPEFLMLWFRRPEFDRYARFMSNGSAREVFGWDDMSDVYLPVPDMNVQQQVVSDYQTIESRVATNEKIIFRLKEVLQSIYRKMFVDDIDPENLPDGWRMGHLSDIAHYVKDKMGTGELSPSNYISTENMLKDRGGITEANSVPPGKCTRFSVGNILVSNIRPYFKKIWLATFEGGCSTDVLCFSANEGFEPEYVYGAIVKDDFFDYVMAGSNGVKMPRGDKNWILNYPVCVPSESVLLEYKEKAKKLIAYQNTLIKENTTLVGLKQLMELRLSQL